MVSLWSANIKPVPSTEFSKQLHESTLHPGFTFRKTRTQEFIASPPAVLCRGCSSRQITYLVVKYNNLNIFFKMPSSSNYMRTWKHFPNEKQAVLSWNRPAFLPWILRAAPSHSNWRPTELLSHVQQSEDQLASSAKDSEELLQMTTQKPSTH